MRDRQGDPLEYVNWKDTGCELYPSCLSCPLPHCIEEQPRGRQRQRMDERSSGMMALRDRGLVAREIAAVYRVSVRTVQRALSRKNGKNKIQIPKSKIQTMDKFQIPKSKIQTIDKFQMPNTNNLSS